MTEAKAALQTGVRALADAEQKRGAALAAVSNGQVLRRNSQPLSPQATRRDLQPVLALPPQPLHLSMQATSAPHQTKPAAAVGAPTSHVSFAMNSSVPKLNQDPMSAQHLLPRMAGLSTNEWRPVGVAQLWQHTFTEGQHPHPQQELMRSGGNPSFAAAQQRHPQQQPMPRGGSPSFAAAPQRHPQPDHMLSGISPSFAAAQQRQAQEHLMRPGGNPSFATSQQRHPQQGSIMSGSSVALQASGPGVMRSLSGPDAYWPPGEQGGLTLQQQRTHSLGSHSVGHGGPLGIDRGGRKLAAPLPLGGGPSGRLPYLGQPLSSAGGIADSLQRSAAAELMPEVGSPAAPIVDDECSLKGADPTGCCVSTHSWNHAGGSSLQSKADADT